MPAEAWTYRPVPLGELPRPCQGCWEADAAVAVWQGRTWQRSLCAACAQAHRDVHGEQLDLFGEEGGEDDA